MLAAWELLCGRTSTDGRVLAEIFMDLPPRELYGDYYELIKRPMCLRLIKEKIDSGTYSRTHGTPHRPVPKASDPGLKGGTSNMKMRISSEATH